MSRTEAEAICRREKKCSLIDLDQLDEKVRRCLVEETKSFLGTVAKFNQDFADSKGVSVEVYFCASERFGAWAYVGTETDYVFVNFAPIVFFNDLFSKIFLSGFGADYFIQWKDRDPRAEGGPDIGDPVNLRLRMWDGIAPEVPELTDIPVATYMLRVAIHSILHHELAHIWNGHAEMLMVTENKIINQSELIDGAWNAKSYAFEMDADCQGVRGLLIWFAYQIDYDLFKIPKELPRVEALFENIEIANFISLASIFFSSIYLSLRGAMFYNKDYRGERSLKNPKTHPPVFFRILAEYNEILNFIKDISPNFVYVAQAILQNVGHRAERAFCEVTGEPAVDLFSEEIQQLYKTQYRTAAESWQDIVPLLQPYKRGERLRSYVVDPAPSG